MIRTYWISQHQRRARQQHRRQTKRNQPPNGFSQSITLQMLQTFPISFGSIIRTVIENQSSQYFNITVFKPYVCSVPFAVTFTIPIGVKWIKVNSGQTGYYRVLYDEDNWGYIVEELKVNHETFSPMVCACINAYVISQRLRSKTNNLFAFGFFYSKSRIASAWYRMHSHCVMPI